jgi:diacylglycerol O-acyltransferase
VPMSTRGGKKELDSGNQIGMAPMALRTDIADAVDRLLAIKRGTNKTKAATSALGKDLAARLIQVIPAAAAEQLVRLAIVSMCNVTVSNVRGPDVPLYMAGAQLEMFLAVSIAFDGIGLNVTGFSYNGTLWVCFVACRDMLPDPDQFCDCLKESFAELLAGVLARNEKPVKVAAGRIPPARTAPVRRRKPASVSADREDGAAASTGPTIPPKRKRTPGVDATGKE